MTLYAGYKPKQRRLCRSPSVRTTYHTLDLAATPVSRPARSLPYTLESAADLRSGHWIYTLPLLIANNWVWNISIPKNVMPNKPK